MREDDGTDEREDGWPITGRAEAEFELDCLRSCERMWRIPRNRTVGGEAGRGGGRGRDSGIGARYSSCFLVGGTAGTWGADPWRVGECDCDLLGCSISEGVLSS